MPSIRHTLMDTGDIDHRVVRGDKIEVDSISLSSCISQQVDLAFVRHHGLERKCCALFHEFVPQKIRSRCRKILEIFDTMEDERITTDLGIHG